MSEEICRSSTLKENIDNTSNIISECLRLKPPETLQDVGGGSGCG
jgi:hypothetical protein